MKTKLVRRFDYETTVAAQVEKTPDGFLKLMCRATRVGVLKYRKPDGGIFRELRHPDEVFDKASMESLALKPFTNEHPPSLLDPTTASLHQVGSVGEIVRTVDNRYLEVMVCITDKETIDDAENGQKVEVSPGYSCQLEMTSGIYDGEPYDAIQRNIRYNHLASVKKGRSGPEVRLRMDADDAVSADLNQPNEGKTMKLKLGGKDFDVADDIGKAVNDAIENAARKPQEEMDAGIKAAVETATSKYKGQADAFESKIKKLKDALEDKEDGVRGLEKDKEKAEAKADAFESELKKLKKERNDSSDVNGKAFRSAVQERIKLVALGRAAGVEKMDDLSDLEIKKAIIKLDDDEANLEGKSDDYIAARFDVASKSIEGAEELALQLGGGIIKKGETLEVTDSDTARDRMIQRQRDQWKDKEVTK